MRTVSRMVVVVSLLFAPVAAQAKVKMTFTPSKTTVAVTQTHDLTAVVTGTTNKTVKFHVCDANGANCVLGGSPTLGTLAETSRDPDNNPVATYVAPAALPSSTVCQPVDTGCRIKLRALIKVGRKKIKKFVIVTLTAPGVTSSPTGGGNGSSTRPARSANGRFTAFASAASNLPVPGGDGNGAIQDIFLFDACLGASGCTPGMTIVSVANDGSPADGASSQPAISADGRFITFVTSATNLLGPGGDTNGVSDIYMRDTCLGAESCTPSTLRVSEGSEPDDFSDLPSISGNGRYVVFRSAATNLLGVGNDTNGQVDIFLRDTCVAAPPGCTPSTLRVSVTESNAEAGAESTQPSISADGRFVVFSSLAPLVGSDANGVADVFLRDTCLNVSGCTASTQRISEASGGGAGGGASDQPVISGNGRFVAFRSAAGDLIGSDGNGVTDIFLRDTCLGAGGGCTPSTRRVSVGNDGSEAAGGDTLEPVVSADGRFVAFRSAATNLIGAGNDNNSAADIFIHDTCGSEPGCTPSTRRVSVTSSGGEAAAQSVEPSLSGDGRFAAFTSLADLTGGGGGGAVENVFLARTGAVVVPLVWVTNSAEPENGGATVSVIDTETNTVIATIPVGLAPIGVALTPDGTRAYVTNYQDDTVSVIDVASLTVVSTIPVGDHPRGVTAISLTPTVYVVNELSDTVSAISTSSDQVYDTIALPAGACARAIGSGGDGAGVTSFCLDSVDVFGIDPAKDPSRYHVVNESVAVGDGPTGGAVRQELERAWITNQLGGTVTVLDIDCEACAPGTAGQVIATVSVGSDPAGAAVTPDGTRLYVAVGDLNRVTVINTANHSIVKHIPVGSTPRALAITPDGARVYVTNFGSSTVSVIDTATNAVVATIPVGNSPCCEMGIAIQFGRSF